MVPVKTWTLYLGSIPFKMRSEFFSEKINAKRAQPCVSSDARAGARVSTSVNKKKQPLLSDYINRHLSATSAVIFTLLIDTN